MGIGSNFTDDALKHLTGLESLTNLHLESSGGTFTDAALEQLSRMEKLTWVTLRRSAFSAEATNRLHESAPGIIINP
jgi:hypothetical protein